MFELKFQSKNLLVVSARVIVLIQEEKIDIKTFENLFHAV